MRDGFGHGVAFLAEDSSMIADAARLAPLSRNCDEIGLRMCMARAPRRTSLPMKDGAVAAAQSTCNRADAPRLLSEVQCLSLF